jgi:hypothetical protein
MEVINQNSHDAVTPKISHLKFLASFGVLIVCLCTRREVIPGYPSHQAEMLPTVLAQQHANPAEDKAEVWVTKAEANK